MDQELDPEEHQFWLSAIQILVHSEQLFVVFRIKKFNQSFKKNSKIQKKITLYTRTFYFYLINKTFMLYLIKSFRYI